LVAQLLVDVLCRQAAIAVPEAFRPPAGGALVARRWELHRHFDWVTTADPEEARQRIFDSDYFSWSEQAQAAILLPRSVSVPLGAEHLDIAAQPSQHGAPRSRLCLAAQKQARAQPGAGQRAGRDPQRIPARPGVPHGHRARDAESCGRVRTMPQTSGRFSSSSPFQARFE
jgi:hypothetical protein